MSDAFVSQTEFMCWNENVRELYGDLFNKSKNFVLHNCIHYIGDMHGFELEGRAYLVLPLNPFEEYEYEGVSFKKIPYSSVMTKRAQTITVSWDKIHKVNLLHCSCQGWADKNKKGNGKVDGVQCSHTVALKLFWKRESFERGIQNGMFNDY